MVRSLSLGIVALVAFAGWPCWALAQQSPPTIHGGIEIGSKGVRGVVLAIDYADGQQRVTRRFAKAVNTTVIHGSQKTNRLREENITATVAEVERFFNLMTKGMNVPVRNLEIVISSGVALAENKQELADLLRVKLALSATFMTHEEELKRVFFGVTPPDQINRAMLLDQGSGNTKTIAFGHRHIGDPGWYVRQHFPLGTVSFTEQIDALAATSGRTFASEVEHRRSSLEAEWNELAKGTPTMRLNRPRAYLTGGIVWALATILHPDQCDQPYVPLGSEDFDRLIELLQQQPGKFPEVNLSELDEPGQYAAAEELQRVRDTFSTKNLLAGAELLRAAARANRFETKELYFARDGLFAWIVGRVNQERHQAEAGTGATTFPLCIDFGRTRRSRR